MRAGVPGDRIARGVRLAFVALAFLPLGGCSISLFTDRRTTDDDRRAELDAMERRVEAVERSAGVR